MFEEEFRHWLEQSHPISTVNQYIRSIELISEHYSRNKNESINLFDISDVKRINEFKELYREGEFEEFGRQQSGNHRAAIQKYFDFAKSKNGQNAYLVNNYKIWIYSPGGNAKHWEVFYKKGIIAINSEGLGDLRQYASPEERLKKYRELDERGIYSTKPKDKKDADGKIKNGTLMNWNLYNKFILNDIRKGDLVIVKKGTSNCIGYGYVTSDYKIDQNPVRDKEYEIYDSCRDVEWHKIDEWKNAGFYLVKGLQEITSDPEYKAFVDSFMDKYVNDNSNSENNRIERMKNPNLILYGPPGTGKTYAVIEKALKVLDAWKDEYKNSEGRKKAVEVFNNFQKQGQIEFTTFHQSYSYEEFIEGIKPEKDDAGISYPVKDGVFKRIALKAQGTDFASFDDAVEKLKKA